MIDVDGPVSVTQLPAAFRLWVMIAYAVKTLYAVGDDLSIVRSARVFEIAFTHNMAPPTFAVESYVTVVKARDGAVPVSPGLNVNLSVFRTR